MSLTKEDIADLRPALKVDPPAYYKGEFHFASGASGVVRFLRRHGVEVSLDGDTGKVTVTQ